MIPFVRKLCLAAALALGPALAFAEATTLWTNTTNDSTFGTPGWDHVIALPGGGFVACTTLDDGLGFSRAVVRCWGVDGGVRWTYEFPDAGAPDVERGKRLCLMPDETIVMAGLRSGLSNELILARLDTQGTELDRETFVPVGTSALNTVTDMVADGAGNLYLSAANDSFGEFRLMKLDPTFATVWDYDAGHVKDIELTATGRVAVCGNRYVGFSNHQAAVALFEADGTLVGHQVMFTSSIADSGGLDSDSAGSLYVVGSDGNLYKFGPNGTPLYSRAVMSGYHNRVRYHEPSNTVYIVGSTMARDLEVTGYTAFGFEKWRTTHTAQIVADLEIELDPWGNVVAAATVDNNGSNENMRAFCYSVEGELQWLNESVGTGSTDESVRALAIDSKARLCIVGGSEDSTGEAYGHAWRTSQYFHKTPDSGTVRIGRRTAGTMESLKSDDGSEYTVCKFVVPNQQTRPIVVEFDVEFPIANAHPGTTDMTVVVRARANTIGLAQWIQLYDWQTSTWTASANYNLTLNEQRYEVQFTNLAPYFEPGTTHVRARIAVGAVGPVSVSLFCVAIDLLELRSDTQ